MSDQQLDKIILESDCEALVEYFEPMKETERKKIADRALQWLQVLNGQRYKDMPPFNLQLNTQLAKDVHAFHDAREGKNGFPPNFTEASVENVMLAILATAGLAELKKIPILAIPPTQATARMMQSRNPKWLDKWCEFALKKNQTAFFFIVYELLRSGACSIERNSSYWVTMFRSLAPYAHKRALLEQDADLRHQLIDMLNDPDVINMLLNPEELSHDSFRKRWRSGGDIFSNPLSGLGSEVQSLQEEIAYLSSKGLLEKEQLVDYSFTLLAREAENEVKKSTSYVPPAEFALNLNRSLISESPESYASRCISLLSATNQNVALYALNSLLTISPKQLAPEEVYSNIAPVFLLKVKEPALKALQLIEQLSKLETSDDEKVGLVLLEALNHKSKEIHKRTLEIIDKQSALKNQAVQQQFSQRLEMLSGMEKKLADSMLEKSGFRSDVCESSSIGGESETEETASIEELRTRASSLNELLSKHAGVELALSLLEEGKCIVEPIDLDNLDFPRTSDGDQLDRIETLDDLIFTFLKVISHQCNGIEPELVLDGVSRLCSLRPNDFEQKTATLLQKITVDDSEFEFTPGIFTQLASMWLTGKPIGTKSDDVINAPLFLHQRVKAIAERAVKRISIPLLAAPTHRGGWIVGSTLVERIKQYEQTDVEIDTADLIQSLLRLAPDGLEEALANAVDLKGEVGRVVRYALGDSQWGPVETQELWVAAFRCRNPREFSKELIPFVDETLPDAAVPVSYGFNVAPIETFNESRYTFGSNQLPDFLPYERASSAGEGPPLRKISSYRPDPDLKLLPLTILHNNANYFSTFPGADSHLWLQNQEPLFALQAKRMLQNINSVGSYWHGDFEFLFDPDISLENNGRYLVCLMMSSKNNDLSRLAVDALIAAIGECRISETSYGDAMAQLLPTGVVTAIRWTRGLQDTMRVSPLHALFVWRSVSRLIERTEVSPTKLIPFFEILMDLQSSFGFPLAEELRQKLQDQKLTGKSAKLVKSLLSGSERENSESTAALLSLEARITRVEGWQQRRQVSVGSASG